MDMDITTATETTPVDGMAVGTRVRFEKAPCFGNGEGTVTSRYAQTLGITLSDGRLAHAAIRNCRPVR